MTIKFSWASLQIPTPKPLPAILIVLLSPLFSPSTCFLDLEEPLILYSDSARLNHAQPFLEPEQRGHLQDFLKLLSLVHLITYKCTVNEPTCRILFLHFFKKTGGKYWKTTNTRKIKKSVSGKPKCCCINFSRKKEICPASVMEWIIFFKLKTNFYVMKNKNTVMF